MIRVAQLISGILGRKCKEQPARFLSSKKTILDDVRLTKVKDPMPGILPSSVARQPKVHLGFLKKPFPGQPSSC
ncbi:hypothetical protein TNCV_2401741 [Trichonephila clavipes]|nr:hypothetical protein TNCV_2401741 [Trichonephila clavipes]